MKHTDEQHDRKLQQQTGDAQTEMPSEAAGAADEAEREFWLDAKYSDDKLVSER